MNDERRKFILFTLVFARVGGLTMTAPIYGTNDVPLRVRVLLAAALALLIVPSQWHAADRVSGQCRPLPRAAGQRSRSSAPAWAWAS